MVPLTVVTVTVVPVFVVLVVPVLVVPVLVVTVPVRPPPPEDCELSPTAIAASGPSTSITMQASTKGSA